MDRLTPDDVINIWRIAKYRAAGFELEYQRTKEEREAALLDLEDLREAEEGDQVPPEEKYD
tara:strand:- start:180 stop:362 length:183 start_codon:yes stop_codon:yes gene_type:complete